MAGALPLNPTNANRYAYTGDNPINATDPTGLYDPNGCNSLACYDVSDELPQPAPDLNIDCELAIFGLVGTGIGYVSAPITFGTSALAAAFGTAGVISTVRGC